MPPIAQMTAAEKRYFFKRLQDELCGDDGDDPELVGFAGPSRRRSRLGAAPLPPRRALQVPWGPQGAAAAPGEPPRALQTSSAKVYMYSD